MELEVQEGVSAFVSGRAPEAAMSIASSSRAHKADTLAPEATMSIASSSRAHRADLGVATSLDS